MAIRTYHYWECDRCGRRMDRDVDTSPEDMGKCTQFVYRHHMARACGGAFQPQTRRITMLDWNKRINGVWDATGSDRRYLIIQRGEQTFDLYREIDGGITLESAQRMAELVEEREATGGSV